MLEHFAPTTATETVLWNEIKRLRTKLRMYEYSEVMVEPYVTEFQNSRVYGPLPETLQIIPGAQLLGNIQADGSIKVVVRGYHVDGMVEVNYYVSPQLLYEWNAANLAEELHGQFIKRLVGELQRPALVKEQTG